MGRKRPRAASARPEYAHPANTHCLRSAGQLAAAQAPSAASSFAWDGLEGLSAEKSPRIRSKCRGCLPPGRELNPDRVSAGSFATAYSTCRCSRPDPNVRAVAMLNGLWRASLACRSARSSSTLVCPLRKASTDGSARCCSTSRRRLLRSHSTRQTKTAENVDARKATTTDHAMSW